MIRAYAKKLLNILLSKFRRPIYIQLHNGTTGETSVPYKATIIDGNWTIGPIDKDMTVDHITITRMKPRK